MSTNDTGRMTLLRALAARYPTADLALAEAAALRASLGLPKGVVHVVSDVHGEYKKLRHIINNASGSLRPLVESLFSGEMSAGEIQRLLAVIYYPHEACEHVRPTLADSAARATSRPCARRRGSCGICRSRRSSWRAISATVGRALTASLITCCNSP
jgi:fructose-1,6-bisphosphatase-3